MGRVIQFHDTLYLNICKYRYILHNNHLHYKILMFLTVNIRSLLSNIKFHYVLKMHLTFLFFASSLLVCSNNPLNFILLCSFFDVICISLTSENRKYLSSYRKYPCTTYQTVVLLAAYDAMRFTSDIIFSIDHLFPRNVYRPLQFYIYYTLRSMRKTTQAFSFSVLNIHRYIFLCSVWLMHYCSVLWTALQYWKSIHIIIL